MVADDAEELVADEPEVPVLELVTQESPREEAASMRARVAAGLLSVAALCGLGAIATQQAPEASANPCGGAVVSGSGGSQCDGPMAADGSFERCTSVYVLGFGGWNCFRVFPPPPPA